MDFELSEELAAVRDLAREFAEKEIAPTAAKDDKAHSFRKDLVAKMGQLGFFGCLIPEEYGGNGLGFLAHALISEEIARVHSAIRVYLNMQAGPAVTLFEFGSEEQRRAFVPGLLNGDSIGCFPSPSPTPGRMWRRCAPRRVGTARDTSSTALRPGVLTRRWRTAASSSPTRIGRANTTACRHFMWI